jgi:hypothetical protein
MVTSKLLSYILENRHLLIAYENWPSLYINENIQIRINGGGCSNYQLRSITYTLDFSFCSTANSAPHKSYVITKSHKGGPACSLLATKASVSDIQVQGMKSDYRQF